MSAKRPYARIGNLGWDTDSVVLSARQVFEEAGISSDKYFHIAAAVGRQGKGSAAEIHFAYEITHTSHSAGCAALRFTGTSDRGPWSVAPPPPIWYGPWGGPGP